MSGSVGRLSCHLTQHGERRVPCGVGEASRMPVAVVSECECANASDRVTRSTAVVSASERASTAKIAATGFLVSLGEGDKA